MQARFPDYDILPGMEGAVQKMLDNSKAQHELGLHLIPLATSIEDMTVTLLDLGVVTPKLKWEKWQKGEELECGQRGANWLVNPWLVNPRSTARWNKWVLAVVWPEATVYAQMCCAESTCRRRSRFTRPNAFPMHQAGGRHCNCFGSPPLRASSSFK